MLDTVHEKELNDYFSENLGDQQNVVLDIGAGQGHASSLLSGWFDTVLGIDHSLDDSYKITVAHCKNCIPIRSPIAYVIPSLFNKGIDCAYIDLGNVPAQMYRYALNMIFPKVRYVIIKRSSEVDEAIKDVTDLWSKVTTKETFHVLT